MGNSIRFGTLAIVLYGSELISQLTLVDVSLFSSRSMETCNGRFLAWFSTHSIRVLSITFCTCI